MKRGVELIAEERQEQINKHGYGLKHDLNTNQEGQLLMAAVFCITREATMWPAGWSTEYRDELYEKPLEQRIRIAGALLAAELDRRNDIEVNESDYMCEDCENMISEEEWEMFGGKCETCSENIITDG